MDCGSPSRRGCGAGYAFRRILPIPYRTIWRDVRVVDGARLEGVCAERYRGFKSLSLRYFCRKRAIAFPGCKAPGPFRIVQVLCKEPLPNPARSGRKQRQAAGFCAVVYLDFSERFFYFRSPFFAFPSMISFPNGHSSRRD